MATFLLTLGQKNLGPLEGAVIICETVPMPHPPEFSEEVTPTWVTCSILRNLVEPSVREVLRTYWTPS